MEKEIYNYLENKYYFGIGRSKYYLNAGLGCESYMSKEQFSNFIDNEINDDPIASREDIIKFMYSYEVRALIADLEKLIIQIEECTYIFMINLIILKYLKVMKQKRVLLLYIQWSQDLLIQF